MAYYPKQGSSLKPSIFDKAPKNKRVRFVEEVEQHMQDEDKEYLGLPALAHLRRTRPTPPPQRSIPPWVPVIFATICTMLRLLGLFMVFKLYRFLTRVSAIAEDSIENDEIIGVYNNGNQFHLSFNPVRSLGVLLSCLVHFAIWFILVIPITWNVGFRLFPMEVQDRLPRFPRFYRRFIEAVVLSGTSLLIKARTLVEFIFVHGILGFLGDCHVIISWIYNQREAFKRNRRVIIASRYWQFFMHNIYGQIAVSIVLTILMRAVVFSDAELKGQAVLAPSAPLASQTIRSLPTKTAKAWFPASSTVPVKAAWDYLNDEGDEQLATSTTPETTRLLGNIFARSRAMETPIPTTASSSSPRSKLQRPTPSAHAHGFEHTDTLRSPHHHSHHHSASEYAHTASHDGSAGLHDHFEEDGHPSSGQYGYTSLITLGYRLEKLEGHKLGYCDLCKQRHGFQVMTADRQLQFHLT